MSRDKRIWNPMLPKYYKKFDPEKFTSLEEYIEEIYNGNRKEKLQIQYNKPFINDEIMVDAVIESEKIAIFFDGPQSYMRYKDVFEDHENDVTLRKYGYTVIHVPYWLPMGSRAVYEIFGIKTRKKLDRRTTFFSDPLTRSVKVDLLPSNMCEAGRLKFLSIFNNLSAYLRKQVYADFEHCNQYLYWANQNSNYVKILFPSSFLDALNLKDVTPEINASSRLVESMVFKRNLNAFEYPYGKKDVTGITSDMLSRINLLLSSKGCSSNNEFNQEVERLLNNNKQLTVSGYIKLYGKDPDKFVIESIHKESEPASSEIEDVSRLCKQFHIYYGLSKSDTTYVFKFCR